MAMTDDRFRKRLSGNTTSTPLAGDATFTGDYEYVEPYATLIVACKADVEGTLYVDFSTSGSGTSESTLTYILAAGINQVHALEITRPYCRIRYTNGSSAQSTFDLIAKVDTFANLVKTPLSVTLNQYTDAVVVRNVSSDIDVAAGRFTGFANFEKFGTNTDIDTAAAEDIWTVGGTYTGFPTGAAETVDVFSSSSSDDEGAAGAEKVTISGLDANYEEQSEEITLNGMSAVTSANTYMRVNRMVVTQSANGANTAFNVGTITCRHTTTTANVFCNIPIGANQTRTLAYTVPANKLLILEQLEVEISKSQSISGTGALWVREFGKPPTFLRNFTITHDNEHNVSRPGRGFLVLPAKTDITIRILSVSGNNTSVRATMDGTLVDTT